MKRATTKLKEFVLYRFLIAVLRRSFRKTPMYTRTLSAAKEDYFEISKSGKSMRRVHFKCALCGRHFVNRKGSREIAVDHVHPVVDPEKGFEGYDALVSRLFNGPLQVLCNYSGVRDGMKSCHKLKTKREGDLRKETNRRLKAEGKSIKTVDR